MADSRKTPPQQSGELRRQVMGQVRALRKRIDPRLLEQVRAAVYGTEGLPTADSTGRVVPTRAEKANAKAAVASFLEGLQDNGAFRRALDRELRHEGRRLEELLPADPPPSPVQEPKGKAAEVLLAAPLPDPKKPAVKTPIKAKKKFWPFF